MTQTQTLDDRELWQACRTGHRDAFRRVVERYQGLVTSITYSATGDIPVSEDLAQDTFVRAWQKMGRLRDPDRLPSWLCAIARNRVRDWLRRRKTDIGRQAIALSEAGPLTASAAAPERRAETDEEVAIVWRAVEAIPHDYREVLILHYREQMTTADMAAALRLTEPAVRQRLSRARAMVKREVAGLVERRLRDTRPSAAFATAVMAALPAVTPKVAAAAVGGVAGKSAGVTLAWATIIGPVIGVLAALFGTWRQIRNGATRRERRFLFGYSALLWLFVGLFLAILAGTSALLRDRMSGPAFVGLEVAMLLVYASIVMLVARWARRRQVRIRREDRTPSTPEAGRLAWSKPAFIYGALGCGIFGAVAWMLILAWAAGDPMTAAGIVAVGLLSLIAGGTAIERRGPGAAQSVLLILTAALATLTAVVVNLRLQSWIARLTGRSLADVQHELPLWTINMLMLVVFVIIAAVIVPGTNWVRSDRIR